jgi:hypothetical protein
LLVNLNEIVSHEEKRYHDFSEKMQLRQVIVGPNSKLRASEIEDVVKNKNVEVFKSRLAFRRFEVTRQKNLSLW